MSIFDEVFNFLEALASGEPLRKEVIDITEINDGDTLWIIDTCDTADCGYETAIQIVHKGKVVLDWVIVERYPDRDAAILGDNKWCLDIEKNHTTYFYSVQDKCIHGVDIAE